MFKRMRYEETRELDDEKFRRLIGVKQATFNKMIEIGRKKISEKKQKVGVKASSVWKIGYLWHWSICENIEHISTLVEAMVSWALPKNS